MSKTYFSDLFQPKIGPEGQIELVPKGSRKDPWINKRMDRCPVCLVKGMVKRGEVIDKTTFGSGRTCATYECHICNHQWVWDKRFKYWSEKQLKEYKGKSGK